MLLIIVGLMFAWLMKPTNTPAEVVLRPSPETRIEGNVFKKAYMDECNISEGFTEYCECGYKFIQDTETMESLASMIASEDQTDFEKMIDSTFTACKSKL